eukprot:IDg15869t1
MTSTTSVHRWRGMAGNSDGLMLSGSAQWEIASEDTNGHDPQSTPPSATFRSATLYLRLPVVQTTYPP